MLKYFRLKGQAENVVPDLGAISASLVDIHIASREQIDDITLLAVHRKE